MNEQHLSGLLSCDVEVSAPLMTRGNEEKGHKGIFVGLLLGGLATTLYAFAMLVTGMREGRPGTRGEYEQDH